MKLFKCVQYNIIQYNTLINFEGFKTQHNVDFIRTITICFFRIKYNLLLLLLMNNINNIQLRFNNLFILSLYSALFPHTIIISLTLPYHNKNKLILNKHIYIHIYIYIYNNK
jgi:hypothetical protein